MHRPCNSRPWSCFKRYCCIIGVCAERSDIQGLTAGGLVANFETVNGTGFFRWAQVGWGGQICAGCQALTSARLAEELVEENQFHDHHQHAEHHETSAKDPSWPFKGRPVLDIQGRHQRNDQPDKQAGGPAASRRKVHAVFRSMVRKRDDSDGPGRGATFVLRLPGHCICAATDALCALCKNAT